MKRFLSTILFLMLAVPAFAQQPVLKGSASYVLTFQMIDSSDHIANKTGLSPTVTISKAGGSFATPSGAVTEVANGVYKVAGNATDSNTDGEIWLHATGSGADPFDKVVAVVVDYDPRATPPTVQNVVDGVLNEAASGHTTAGTTGKKIGALPDTAFTGLITLQKNVAYTNFPIWMISSADAAVTGLATSAIACQFSLDNGAFANLNDTTEVEVGLGKYVVDLLQAETNGNVMSIVCTASGARVYRVDVSTQR